MKYLSVDCHLDFASPTRFRVNPLFMIRSILGNSLRHECCSDLKIKCAECGNSDECLFSNFFEGVRNKNGMRMHPYSLHMLDEFDLHVAIESFNFRIILYGDDAASMYPYIYVAFVKAGERGITKERIPFQFSVLKTGLKNHGKDISIKDAVENWSEETSDYGSFSGKIRLSIKTPLRFQYRGHYGTDFSLRDLFSCLLRRTSGMINMFGESSFKDLNLNMEDIEMRKINLLWVDYSHYSARQQTSMMLGGLMGEIELSGSFSSPVLMLLDFAENFSAGKNVVFGLGNVEVWKKEAV